MSPVRLAVDGSRRAALSACIFLAVGRLHAADSPPQPVGPATANIIIIGDSITAGTSGVVADASYGYPAVMQYAGIGQGGALIYNLGMLGERIADMAGQFFGATGTNALTTTVTTVAGSMTATLGSADGVTTALQTDMSIGASTLLPNTRIVAVTGTTVTLSANARLSGTVACSIATPVQDIASGASFYPGSVANGWANFTNTAYQLSSAITGVPTYVFILAGTNDIRAGAIGATVTTVANSNNATISSGTNVAPGDIITGSNFNDAPFVTAVSGHTITLSSLANATGATSALLWAPVTVLSAIESSYTQLVAEAHADGDTIVNGGGVIALTLLPRGNSTDSVDSITNLMLINFNNWLKSGASGADYVFDTNSAMPPFGPATSNIDYSADQLHLSSQGAQLLGTYISGQFFLQIDSIVNTFSAWTAEENLSDASADPSAVLQPDGFTNLMKYALGLNPAINYSPGSSGLPAVAKQSGYLTLTFTGVATDVGYTVQAANSPAGPWNAVSTFSGSPPPGTVTVQDTQAISAAPSRFMRLQVATP